MKKLERNEKCWCGSGVKYKYCHAEFDQRLMEFEEQGYIIPSRDLIKNSNQIEQIRESGKVNIAILDYVSENIRAGITTEDINTMVYEKTLALGGRPAPLHYHGFPKSVCTSINHEVCHGIPSKETVLCDGDIINVDVSTQYKGYYSDSSRMFCIGSVSSERKKLTDIARECVDKGLQQVLPWHCLGNMGEAVQTHAHQNGCSIVREIGGHGVGLEFHEEPWVGYVSKRDTEMLMVPGMIFTIEPMVNRGTPSVVTDKQNGWTIYTADGQPSAQWEIMVLVTETGHEVLAH